MRLCVTRNNLREEQNLDGDSQPSVQRHNDDQQYLARPHVSRAQHRVPSPSSSANFPQHLHPTTSKGVEPTDF